MQRLVLVPNFGISIVAIWISRIQMPIIIISKECIKKYHWFYSLKLMIAYANPGALLMKNYQPAASFHRPSKKIADFKTKTTKIK